MSLFHERFKVLRDISGKTQAKIAEDLGMTPQALSYYSNGREPSYDTLIAIAKYFGVTTDYLLGVSDHKSDENSAISKQIPLSDKAIDFLKTVPPELQPILDKFLSDPNAGDFLLELMTYVYSLGNTETSEAADLLAAQIIESGSSKTTPEVARILACRLTPLLQQTRLINALNNVAVSLNERSGGFDGSMLE